MGGNASASKHSLKNLILLIDYNKLQSYGRTNEILDLEPLTAKLKSFNFNTVNINGHSIKEIDNAIKKLIQAKKPTAIICHTVKGKGIKIAENNPFWHHKSMLTDKDFEEIEKSLGK